MRTAVGAAEPPEKPDRLFGTITLSSGGFLIGGFRTSTAALRGFTASNVTFRPTVGIPNPHKGES